MGRSRSRSRSRSRGRRRSRERRRSRTRSPAGRGGGFDPAAAIAAQLQQAQMAAMQQQELQRQLLAQQMLGTGGSLPAMMMGGGGDGLSDVKAAASAQDTVHRKQREIYIGNLAIGLTTKEVLYEFWNQVFAHLVPDPVACPPVHNINMDSQGRFAFVEFQNDEMATKALEMDHVVEINGRAMHIGRPKGYVPPAPGEKVPPAGTSAAGALPAAAPIAVVGGVPTVVLLLSGILPAGQLRTEAERRVLQEEVYEEASRYGQVGGVYVASPTAAVQDLMPGRCYVKYGSPEDAAKGRAVFHGRTLDGHTIKAMYVPEEEYARAAGGEWVQRHSGVAGIPLPGLYSITPLPVGITGLSALNPTLAALVTTNPGIVQMVTADIEPEEVPFEPGHLKLRGFPPQLTKEHIVAFLRDCDPDLGEGDIKMVLSADGTPLGEAFVHLHGPRAKLRLALAKDRSACPPSVTPLEVITAVEEDQQRRRLTGCQLV